MIPYLFAPSETDFNSNGIGRLTDCVSCEVVEERNGIYECEFKYPVIGKHFSDIREGMLVAVTHGDTDDIQPFEIYAHSAPMNGVVTFNAHHISYRLNNVMIAPFTASSANEAFVRLKASSINANDFTFQTDKTTQARFDLKTPASARAVLGGVRGSILDVYTGEYEWDKFTVKLHAHRGKDRGVEIRYGKNLVDITQEVDADGLYNSAVPYYFDDDNEVLITAPNYIVGSSGGSNKPIALDLTSEFDEAPTPEELAAKALQILESQQSWIPSENITVDFVDLWNTPQYAQYEMLQKVALCDTVTVYYTDLGLVASKSKVIKTTWNVLKERYDEIELGEPKSSLAQTLSRELSNDINKIRNSLDKYTTKGFLDDAIEHATQLITGGYGGHLYIGTNEDGEPNELYILDTTSIDTARNVLRINMNGIGFSHNGYNGNYSTAWTLDGHFVADWIDSGTLNANVIRAGVLTGGDGTNFWNLETGEMNISGDSISMTAGDKATIYVKGIVDDSIEEIDVGAKNYLRMTANPKIAGIGRWNTGDWAISSGGDGVGTIETISDPPITNITKTFRITGNTTGNRDLAQRFLPLVKGETYTFSAWVRAIGDPCRCLIRLWKSAPSPSVGWATYDNVTDTTWKRVKFTFTLRNEDFTQLNIQFGVGGVGSIEYLAPKLERGTVATDWSPAPEDAETELTDFATEVENSIQDLQDQLDGVVDTYYYDYAPTASNYPANEWTTEQLKSEHEGDLFLDTSTGRSYRWLKDNNVWQWKEIPDTAAAQALQIAQQAKDTADGKRRVFVDTPYVPYDVGDLWFEGDTGDILTCTTAKTASQAYSRSDWTKLNKYTDDTAIENLEIGGRNYYIERDAVRGLIASGTSGDISAQNTTNLEMTSAFIPVTSGEHIIFQYWLADRATRTAYNISATGWMAYQLYDANKVASARVAKSLSADDAYGVYEIDIPSGIKYIRVSFRSLGKNGAGQIKVEKGTKPTEYSLAPEDEVNQGGRNILLKSNFTNCIRRSGSTQIDAMQEGVSVTEWGASDAIRITGTSTTSTNSGIIVIGGADSIAQTPITFLDGRQYTFSVYIKNNHATSRIFVRPSLYSYYPYWQFVEPGEAKYLTFTLYGNGSTTNIQLIINIYENAGQAIPFDVTIWHPMIEYGRTASTWRPAPEDTQTAIAESMDNLVIGGTNILRGTEFLRPTSWVNGTWEKGGWSDSNAVRNVTRVDINDSPVDGVTRAVRLSGNKVNKSAGICQRDVPLKRETLCFSVWVKGVVGDRVRLQSYWASSQDTDYTEFTLTTNTWTRLVSVTKKAPELEATYTAGYIYLYPANTDNELYICAPMLEYATKPSAYTPSPYDAIADYTGGRNLLLKSNVPVETSNYLLANYRFGNVAPIADEFYTLQIKGTLGNNKTAWGIYNTTSAGGANAPIVLDTDANDNFVTQRFYDEATGIYTAVLKWQIGDTANTSLRVYHMPNSVTEAVSTIEWIKLEKGTVATDYSEAPEDIDARTEDLRDYVTDNIDILSEQIDGKIDTYYQAQDPSTDTASGNVPDAPWNTLDKKQAHDGDLWYNTTASVQKLYRWTNTSGSNYSWQETKAMPPTGVMDTIDGKGAIYTGTSVPTPPYQVGDLWLPVAPTAANVKTAEIKTCITARTTAGTQSSSDWVVLNKYTDDTKFEELEPVVSASVKSADVEYYSSTSPTALSGGSWSTNAPTWQEGRYIWTRTKWTQNSGQITYSKATCITGNTSATYYLQASADSIVKSESGTYSPTSITFTGWSKVNTGTPAAYTGRFVIAESTNGSSWTTKYTSSSDEASKTYTPTSTAKLIRCSFYDKGGTTSLLDLQTVPIVSDGATGATGAKGDKGDKGAKGDTGADAYTVVLSNENHTFAAGTSAAIASSTTCDIIAFKGATRVAATIGSITGAPTGMSTSISNNGTTNAYFTVSVTTSMTTKNGVLTVPVTVDGKAFSMRFTYSLAIRGTTGAKGDKGDTGAQGIGIQSVTEIYYCSDSSTVPNKPTAHVTVNSATSYNTWNLRPATWTATMKYYYTCSEILYTNGSYDWSAPVSNTSMNVTNEKAANAVDTANQARLYGTCSTNATTASKVVQCANCKSLTSGLKIDIYFNYANVVNNAAITLNVNGTGAKTVYVAGAPTSNTNQLLWAAGGVLITFIYNGTYWIPEGFSDVIQGKSDTQSATAEKVLAADKCIVAKGTRVSCTFSYQNTASSPTLSVGGTGARSIVYSKGTNPIWNQSPFSWKANSAIDFVFTGSAWQMVNVNIDDFLGYYDEYLDETITFKKLTNDGRIKGIYQENNQLYINATYIKSGTLTLGGNGDTPKNGILELMDNSNKRYARWDNKGLYMGNIASSLTSPNFNVTTGGVLTAKGATISGNFTMTGGSININSNTFKVATDGTLTATKANLMSSSSSTYTSIQNGVFSAGRVSGSSRIENGVLNANKEYKNYPNSVALYAKNGGLVLGAKENIWFTNETISGASRGWVNSTGIHSSSSTTFGPFWVWANKAGTQLYGPLYVVDGIVKTTNR